MSQTKKRIAIVVQRYGLEVNGGAELHARWLAEHLLSIVDVDVFTTCAVDYITWANHYPAGKSEINGVQVYRFPVDIERYGYRAPELPNSVRSLIDQYREILRQGPISSRMLRMIEQTRHQYDAFIFFTYLYPTTVLGMQLVPDKAILIPTAHDEPSFYVPIFRTVFHLPSVIVCNTAAERDMIRRVMRNKQIPQIVAGIGIDLPPEPASAERFRARFGIDRPFFFYVGRIDSAKNVDELMDWFIRYKQARDHDCQLVLAGKPHLPIPDHPDIKPIGFISEQEKFDGIKAAECVIQPSLYESLSMIALETWLMEKPMVTNAHCEIVRRQVTLSQGGLSYTHFDEFCLILDRMLDHPAERHAMGRSGRAFVEATYDWVIIVAKFQAVFETMVP